jgi:RHS repeat-associated protein
MKNWIIVSAALICHCMFNSVAQSQTPPHVQGDQADISLLNINSGNLLDRGSTFVGGSFIKGAVNVSDYSGNMTIGHSIDINYPNDLKTKLSFTFNSNACHAYFEDFVGRYNKNMGQLPIDQFTGETVRENSVNAACWIFGINGIALQTTNFEKNFFLGSNDDPTQEDPNGYRFSGTQVPLLAAGYQYTNDIKFPGDHLEQVRLGFTGNWGPTPTRKDAIRIMTSEGSVLTLQNPTFFSSTGTQCDTMTFVENLTGMYFDTDEQSNGYAIVSWKDNIFGLRKIYYKPGDGLTYYFEEEYVKYQNLSLLSNWGGRMTNPPKIAYLRNIQSQNGDSIVFSYDYQNIFGVDVTHGRKFLKKIQYFKSNGSLVPGAEILFTYVKTNGVYQIGVQNNLSGESYAISLNNYNPANNSQGFDNIVRDTSGACSNIMQVDSITNNNNSNKSVSFSYGNHNRKYTYGALTCGPQFPSLSFVGVTNYYYLNYSTKKMTSRKVLNGEKNDFDFWTDYELGSNIWLYDATKSYSIDSRYVSKCASSSWWSNAWPKEYLNNDGYYINAYSNAPNDAYYSNRYLVDLFFDAPLTSLSDSAGSIWYRYFEAYNFRNMNNTMRDNYAATMIRRITNSVYNGSGGYNPIDSVRYDYNWGKTQYNGNNPATNQMYNDMSAKITNIKTTIKTTNLNSETSSAASNTYTETKNYELLKVTSKIRSPQYEVYSFGNNFTTAQKLDSNVISDANGNILQSIRYAYNINASITNTWGHIVNRAWQNYYNIQSPADLTLASKVVQYKGITKATVYSSENIKQYQYLYYPGRLALHGDYCLINNLLGDTTTTEETYRKTSSDMQMVRNVHLYTEQFGIYSASTNIGPSIAANNTNYIYRPSLPVEAQVYIKKGSSSSGTFQRKSRTVNVYSTTAGITYGKLSQQTAYGLTDDAPVTTTYYYNIGGSYPGCLSQITYDNGSSVQYKYYGEVSPTGKLYCTNGTTITNPSVSWNSNIQPQPFQTIKNYDGKSITAFTAFDGKANLIFSADENGYYSVNYYDALGRIKRQAIPGNYNPNNYYLPLNEGNAPQGSAQYSYNDNLWTPQLTTTAYLDNSGTNIQTMSKFSPDSLASENYAVVGGSNILKSKEKINYLGQKWYSRDGDGYRAYYYYDAFMNHYRTRFTSSATSAPTKYDSVKYDNTTAYFKRIKLIDENGNYEYNDYDLYGNILKNTKYLGTKACSTSFAYDNLGRLQTATTPENKASTYTYDTRGNISSRVTPDAGTTQYLYDKYGNIRLIQDANHIGTTTNPGTIVSTTGSSNNSANFTLNMPGKVTIGIYLIGGSSGTISIIKNGATLCSATTTGGIVQNSIILPKGTYTWSFTATGGAFNYSVTCGTANEFVYNKYDGLNRLIETGEYQNNSTADFIQSNADSPTFPASNTLVTKKIIYDIASSDPLAAGQRNLNGRISETDAYYFGGLCNQTFYSYNELGKLEWEVQYGLGYYTKKLYYWYDLQGNITKKGYADLTTGYNMYTFYDYDQHGRLFRVWTDTDPNGTAKVKEGEYSYSNGNRVTQLKLGATPAQTVDYTYNNRGWLNKINDPNSIGTDKFAMILGYDNQAEIASGTGFSWQSQKNGNISWIAYKMPGVNYNSKDLVGWVYKYDSLSRLTKSDFGYKSSAWTQATSYDENYSFSDDGNFKTLQRYGSGSSVIDNLSYKYRPNTNIDTLITNSAGTGSTYTYDYNGNVVSDSRSGIAFMIYDINNLPATIFKTTGKQVNQYDVNGARVRKYASSGTDTYYLNDPTGKTELVQIGVYNDVYTYNIIGNDNIGQVQRNGGDISRYYYLKDHLGSVKVVVNTSGVKDSHNDFYPFGLQMPNRNQTASADGRLKFTGKERDAAETGWDYFGARYLDSWRGQWGQVDPLSPLHPDYSPFAYVKNNPIRFIDPFGLDETETDGKGGRRLVLDPVYVIADNYTGPTVANHSNGRGATIVDPRIVASLQGNNINNIINSTARGFIQAIFGFFGVADEVFTAPNDMVEIVGNVQEAMNDNPLEERMQKIARDWSKEGVAITPEVKKYIYYVAVGKGQLDQSSLTTVDVSNISAVQSGIRHGDTIFYDVRQGNKIMSIDSMHSNGTVNQWELKY